MTKLIEIVAAGSALLALAGTAPAQTSVKPQRADHQAKQPAQGDEERDDAPDLSPDADEGRQVTSEEADAILDTGEWKRADIDESRWGKRDTQMPAPSDKADDVPDAPGNYFKDWSFERFTKKNPQTMAWFHMAKRGWRNRSGWSPFELTELRAHSGARSVHLHMNSDAQRGPTRVHGVVQEVTPDHLPQYISGWYRVEDWQRGALKQYIQVVVIARGSSVVPEGLAQVPNFQVSMVLAGIDQTPFPITNRRFHFDGPMEPEQDEWQFFEFDLHQMFDQLWGVQPENFEALKVFFEVRYDYRGTGPSAKADVYFDDLYIGDESRMSAARAEIDARPDPDAAPESTPEPDRAVIP